MSLHRRPLESSPVSASRFYIQLFLAAVVILGAATALVWYTNE